MARRDGAEAVGRNAPCPCGSGRKHKRCCGSSTAQPGPIGVVGTTQSLWQIATEHVRAGRLLEAETACARILGTEPDNDTVLNLSGAVVLRLGKPELALPRLQRAVELVPNNANYRCSLGDVYRALDRSVEAVVEFRAAWRLAPNHPTAVHRLIAVLMQQGRLEEGLSLFSVEALETAMVAAPAPGAEYGLTLSGRFAHASRYIQELCARYGFAIERVVEAVLRQESEKPSSGWLYLLRRL